MTVEHPLHEMVRLLSADNPFDAHLMSQALQDVGIHARVVGDYLDAGIGNVPGLSAELWVDAQDAARAAGIIEAHQNHLAEQSSKPEIEEGDNPREE